LVKPASIVIVAAAVLMICALDGSAQIAAPPINRDTLFKNNIGFGGSVGYPYQRDAWFWGLSAA